MRDELLNESLFFDLDQARQVIGAWVADYNGETAFFARIQDAGSLCRTSHRAEGRINSRGSNRHWMKVQWQVIRPKMVGPNC
jgi:putative transposase